MEYPKRRSRSGYGSKQIDWILKRPSKLIRGPDQDLTTTRACTSKSTLESSDTVTRRIEAAGARFCSLRPRSLAKALFIQRTISRVKLKTASSNLKRLNAISDYQSRTVWLYSCLSFCRIDRQTFGQLGFGGGGGVLVTQMPHST